MKPATFFMYYIISINQLITLRLFTAKYFL